MNARDPRWLPLAESIYALVLRLYPRDLRDAHGAEMRQAFRDRCREVATGRIRAWRLLSVELMPDLVTSIAASRFAESRGSASPRALAGIALLGLLAIFMLFQEAISPRLNDAVFQSSARWRHWQEGRALLRDEAQVRGVAEALAASPRAEERALAAYLYRTNERGRDYAATYAVGAAPIPFEPLAADGERASKLLDGVPLGGDAAQLAEMACTAGSSCNRAARVQAFVRAEPDNAYALAQLLKLHSLAGDDSAVAADLRQIARSTRYDDGQSSTRIAAYSAVSRLAPGDAGAMAAMARRLSDTLVMEFDDFRHSLRFHCSIAVNGRSAWLRAHPESLPDCRAVAELMAKSDSPRASDWGWRWLVHDRATPENRAGLDAATTRISREIWDVGVTPLGGSRTRPWTDAEWQDWALAKLEQSGH